MKIYRQKLLESELKKKGSETFNVYTLELSWSQLQAVHQALEADHSGPVADELFAEITWYLANVPPPGVSNEDWKAQKEAEEGETKEEKDLTAAEQGPTVKTLKRDIEKANEPLEPEEEEISMPPEESEAEQLLPAPPER